MNISAWQIRGSTLTVKTREMPATFAAPSPDLRALFYNSQGERVGWAEFAISPLHDRSYLFHIQVVKRHRRAGYGQAFVQYLGQHYKLPIVPMVEMPTAKDFWRACRVTAEARGIEIAAPLTTAEEIYAESARWQHLLPRAARAGNKEQDLLGGGV